MSPVSYQTTRLKVRYLKPIILADHISVDFEGNETKEEVLEKMKNAVVKKTVCVSAQERFSPAETVEGKRPRKICSQNKTTGASMQIYH